MSDNKTLSGILAQEEGSSKKRPQPKPEFFKKDPILESIVKKLVKDDKRAQTPTGIGSEPIELPSDALIQKITQKTATSVTDAKSIFQVLPDLELASQILISCIISPKDMVDGDLNFALSNESFAVELATPMLSEIETHFTEVYKIKPILPQILEEILFTKGSYPVAILPESSIDEAINRPNRVTLESVSDVVDSAMVPRNLGLLGDPTGAATTTISFENYTVPAEYDANVKHKIFEDKTVGGIRVLDNPHTLKMPNLHNKIKQDKVRDLISTRRLGLESRTGLDAKNVADGLDKVNSVYYKRRQYGSMPVLNIRTADEIKGKSHGHPLVMKIPAEAMVPVHVPSAPDDHIGYFIILDMMGNPLTLAGEIDHYSDLASAVHRNKTLTSNLISNARGLSEDQKEKQLDIEEAVNSYGTIVENDLKRRLAAGIYGENVKIARKHEIYRMMLGRAAAQMQTQMLYVPAELVTYMAFDYNDFGVGESLIEKSKIIGGIRSMLMFANTMAGVKNSVGRTGMEINLDPEDPDPQQTVEFLMHEYAKTRQASYPLGASSPVDIINYLQNAAIDVSVSGNTRYPETSVDVQDRSGNVANVDTDLEEEMKKRHIMSFGISPDMVESAKEEDFATSVVSRNLLLSKRVKRYQDKICYFLTDFIVKYTLNSEPLIDALVKHVEANKKLLDKEQSKLSSEEVVMTFLNALLISLPSPDSATLEGQMSAYEEYADAVETVIEAYVSDEFVTDLTVGENVSADIDEIRGSIAAHFKRQWLRSNNILPEIANLTVMDKDGKTPMVNMLDIQSAHFEALSKSVEQFVLDRAKSNAKRAAKFDKAMDKIQEEEDDVIDPNDDLGGGSDDPDDPFGDPNGEPGGDGGDDPDPEPEPEIDDGGDPAADGNVDPEPEGGNEPVDTSGAVEDPDEI